MSSDSKPRYTHPPSHPDSSFEGLRESLPRSFRRPPAGVKLFGIWGTMATGKTTYLAALYEAFQRDDRPRNWRMQANTDETDEWLQLIHRGYYRVGRFPPQTRLEIETIRYPSFSFQDVEDRPIFSTMFMDASGETFRDPIGYALEHGENPLDYLRECDGILMLVNPVPAKRYRHFADFNAVYHAVRGLAAPSVQAHGKRCPIPMAFCLTMCDEPDCREPLEPPPHYVPPREFALRVFGDSIGEIDTYCETVAWFACSALGYEQGKPPNTHVRWNGNTGIRNPEQLRPRNVVEPLIWLHEQSLAKTAKE